HGTKPASTGLPNHFAPRHAARVHNPSAAMPVIEHRTQVSWFALCAVAVVLAIAQTVAGTPVYEPPNIHEVASREARQPIRRLSARDQRLIREAYERGRYEIEAAQLALENSRIVEVHVLAARIVETRRRIDEELKGLAEQAGMTALSDQLDATHRE